MEYTLTRQGMGRKRRQPECRAIDVENVPGVAEVPVGAVSVRASPDVKGLTAAHSQRGRSSPLGAKAAYLLQDTLKVLGASEIAFDPATAALFYVNETDPLSGGTGHTLRVCICLGLPVITQRVWCGRLAPSGK